MQRFLSLEQQQSTMGQPTKINSINSIILNYNNSKEQNVSNQDDGSESMDNEINTCGKTSKKKASTKGSNETTNYSLDHSSKPPTTNLFSHARIQLSHFAHNQTSSCEEFNQDIPLPSINPSPQTTQAANNSSPPIHSATHHTSCLTSNPEAPLTNKKRKSELMKSFSKKHLRISFEEEVVKHLDGNEEGGWKWKKKDGDDDNAIVKKKNNQNDEDDDDLLYLDKQNVIRHHNYTDDDDEDDDGGLIACLIGNNVKNGVFESCERNQKTSNNESKKTMKDIDEYKKMLDAESEEVELTAMKDKLSSLKKQNTISNDVNHSKKENRKLKKMKNELDEIRKENPNFITSVRKKIYQNQFFLKNNAKLLKKFSMDSWKKQPTFDEYISKPLKSSSLKDSTKIMKLEKQRNANQSNSINLKNKKNKNHITKETLILEHKDNEKQTKLKKNSQLANQILKNYPSKTKNLKEKSTKASSFYFPKKNFQTTRPFLHKQHKGKTAEKQNVISKTSSLKKKEENQTKHRQKPTEIHSQRFYKQHHFSQPTLTPPTQKPLFCTMNSLIVPDVIINATESWSSCSNNGEVRRGDNDDVIGGKFDDEDDHVFTNDDEIADDDKRDKDNGENDEDEKDDDNDGGSTSDEEDEDDEFDGDNDDEEYDDDNDVEDNEEDEDKDENLDGDENKEHDNDSDVDQKENEEDEEENCEEKERINEEKGKALGQNGDDEDADGDSDDEVDDDSDYDENKNGGYDNGIEETYDNYKADERIRATKNDIEIQHNNALATFLSFQRRKNY